MKIALSKLFCFLSFFTTYALAEKIPSVDFTVTKHTYWGSSNIDFRDSEQLISRVTRSGWWQYTYDYFDVHNNQLAQGNMSSFSLSTVIDIHDAVGAKLGSIESQYWTKARRKYVIYDEKNSVTGVAYLSDESSNFLVVSPINNKVTLAKLQRSSYGDIDYWDVKFENGSPFDDRVIKIFAAFVADYQDVFKPFRQIRHNHIYSDYRDSSAYSNYER